VTDIGVQQERGFNQREEEDLTKKKEKIQVRRLGPLLQNHGGVAAEKN